MATSEEVRHSDLPPSSADKWFHCHAWLKLTRSIPQKPSSPAAEEGTRAHAYLEKHLLGEQLLEQATEPGMFDYLSSCVDWIETQVQETQGLLYVESRVDFGAGFGFVGLTGTADVVVVSDKELLVADLKYGFGLVEARRNLQLMTYLVGVVHQHGPREKYRLAVMQPRAEHPEGRIRQWEVDNPLLEEFSEALDRAITANYKGGPAKTGRHCRNYCPALGSCPAVTEQAIKLYRSLPVA